MVPHFNPYESWWDIFDEGPGNGKDRGGNDASNGQEGSIDMSLSPEPEWMYYAPWEQEDLTLDPFVSNHHATLLIGRIREDERYMTRFAQRFCSIGTYAPIDTKFSQYKDKELTP